jgi:hypothetical protein
MNKKTTILVLVGLVAVWADRAAAQSSPGRFEVGAQMSTAVSGEFDETVVGVGGRFSWHPGSVLGIESEFNVYPEELVFSGRQLEGLFGVTVGPWLDRMRPFAKLRAGFLNVGEARRPFACILIYPPPLSCELASGRTLTVFDLGGGVEASVTPRTFVRVEAGDRLVKYPGPIIDRNREVQEDSFFGHDFRFAFGAGLRF